MRSTQKILTSYINVEVDPLKLTHLLNLYKLSIDSISNPKVYSIIESLNYLTSSAKHNLGTKLTSSREIIEQVILSENRTTLRYLASNPNLTNIDIENILQKAIKLKESAVIIALLNNSNLPVLEILKEEKIYTFISNRKEQPPVQALVNFILRASLRELNALYSLEPAELNTILGHASLQALNKVLKGEESISLESLLFLAKQNKFIANSASLDISPSLIKILTNSQLPVAREITSTLYLNRKMLTPNTIAIPNYEITCTLSNHTRILSYAQFGQEYLFDSHLFAQLISLYEDKSIEGLVDFLKIEKELTLEILTHSNLIRERLTKQLDLISKSPILTSLLNQPNVLEKLHKEKKFTDFYFVKRIFTGEQALNIILSIGSKLNSSEYVNLLSISLVDPATMRKSYDLLLNRTSAEIRKVISLIDDQELLISSRILSEIVYDSFIPEPLLNLTTFLALKDLDTENLTNKALGVMSDALVLSNLPAPALETFFRLIPEWDDSFENLITTVSLL